LEDPDDKIWDEDEYFDKKGDYRTNGLGHTKTTYMGVTGILVPAPRVWTIKRARGNIVDKVTDFGNDSTAVSDKEIDNNFAAFMEQMKGPQAVGATLDPLLQGRASSSRVAIPASPSVVSSPKKLAQPAAARTPQSAEKKFDDNPFATAWTTEVPPVTETAASSVSGTPAEETRGGNGRQARTKPIAKTKRAAGGSSGGGVLGGNAAAASRGGDNETRGRKSLDNPVIAKTQLRQFGSADEADDAFFGANFQKHHAFLKRIKGGIEKSMQSAKERLHQSSV
jgi:hypothetical protein